MFYMCRKLPGRKNHLLKNKLIMKHLATFVVVRLGLLLNSCTTTSESPFVDGVTEALNNDGKVNVELMEWTREPQGFGVNGDTLTITTAPHTDLWQRTYYHFRNDNAPVFQMKTREKYFSFVVKTDFTQSHHRFGYLLLRQLRA